MTDAAPARHPRVAGLWSAQHRTLTVGLVLTITLVAFEALAVATVMPIVVEDLGSASLYGWVFTSFLLASLIAIVAVGGLIDGGGLARPFAAGLVLFSVGLIVAGVAPSMETLIAGRALQGLGAGAIPPIGYVAIGRRLPEQLRARMFATLSTAWVLPGVIGPAISGIVGESLGWRVVFLGLLPLIAIAGAMTLPVLSASGPSDAGEEPSPDGQAREPSGTRPPPDAGAEAPAPTGPPMGRRRRLAWAFVVAAGAGLAVAGLTDASLVPGVPLVVGGLALGLPAFRVLTPPGTLAVAAGLPAAVVLRGLLTFAFFCADAYVPRALQEWRGLDAATSGIALTSATLAWTAGAWIQAPRFLRIGARRFVMLGFATLALGIVGFATILSPAVPVWFGIATWAIAGLGMGLSYSPLSLVVLSEAAAGSEGTATSGLQLSDVLGTALGTGIGGAIIAAGAAAGLEGWVGFAASFAVGVLVAVLGSLLARRLPGPPPRRASTVPARPALSDP